MEGAGLRYETKDMEGMEGARRDCVGVDVRRMTRWRGQKHVGGCVLVTVLRRRGRW